jgi:hypothetical protein
MAKMDGWEKCKTRFYDEKYGQQRGWVKKENATVSNIDELPF